MIGTLLSHYRIVAPLAEGGMGVVYRAHVCLERAHQARDRAMIYLQVNPRFDALRPDPRFEALVSRMGFPE